MTTRAGGGAAGGLRAGVDLVAVADVAAALGRFGPRYLERCYTPGERQAAAGAPEVAAAALAARFAAKEAVMKVLEPPRGARPPAWSEIEVVRLASGAPRLALHGEAALLAARQGIGAMAVSLCHEGPVACAVVVASLAAAPPVPDDDETVVHQREYPHQGDRSMEEDIRTILAEHGRLPVDAHALDADADLYQVGLTSHASVNVMLAIEEHFGIEFPPAMLRKRTFGSVSAIREALSSLTTARA